MPDIRTADHAERDSAKPLVPGNIDLYHRPVVRNRDGSISTVASMTFEDDKGRFVLVPGVIPDPKRRGRYKVGSPDDAWRHYEETGQHLGIFPDEPTAERAAVLLHEAQQQIYAPGRPRTRGKTLRY